MISSLRNGITSRLGGDSLFANVDFRRFWLSGVLESFGGQISGLALPLCAVLLLQATPAQMGMLAATGTLPFAIFTLPAGVWLDRSRKFPILLSCELMYGLTLSSIAVAYWFGILSMPWLYTVGFINAMGTIAGGGAQQIFLTGMVGRERVIDAQAIFTATDSAAKLIGPGIAGVLVQVLTAPAAILVNAIGYFVSLWNLSKIRVHETPPVPSGRHPLREMKDGLAFVWLQPLLRTLAFGVGVWHFLFFGYVALLVLFATRVLHMSPGVLGFAQMLAGVGVLFSSMLLKPLTRRIGQGRTILLGLSLTALVWVLISLLPAALFGLPMATAIAYGCLMCVFDCGVMLFIMPYVALRQKITPDDMLGRMISTMRFLTLAAGPVGALAAGYLADHFSVRTGMACIGIGGAVMAAYMAVFSPLRHAKT